METLSWGARVSDAFRTRVEEICAYLDIDASDLMACMAFETGATFDPAIRNRNGSGAVGLIQFMPQTAAALGTTVEQLAGMTAEAQLEYVADYLRQWTGRLHNLGDVYGAILWPGMIGRPDDFVVFQRDDPLHPARYAENAGLDLNGDGLVTRAEVCSKVNVARAQGLQPGNAWSVP